jgi:RNA recognition motif-containing protein
VTMSNEQEGRTAIKNLGGKDFGGRPLIVNEARPKEDRPKRSSCRSGLDQNETCNSTLALAPLSGIPEYSAEVTTSPRDDEQVPDEVAVGETLRQVKDNACGVSDPSR